MEFNPYDVATKELVWEDPLACLERFWVACTGVVDVIDSDITTLTASADKVIRVLEPEPYLVNIELQSYHDSTGSTRNLNRVQPSFLRQRICSWVSVTRTN